MFPCVEPSPSLAVLLPLTLVPLSASAYEPRRGVTFNVPNPWGNEGENTRIVNEVEEAFRNVRPTARDPNPIILVPATSSTARRAPTP